MEKKTENNERINRENVKMWIKTTTNMLVSNGKRLKSCLPNVMKHLFKFDPAALHCIVKGPLDNCLPAVTGRACTAVAEYRLQEI